MYKHCWNLINGIFYISVINIASSQQKGLDKSVNLALETVFEFDKDGKSDMQLLNNVQKFIGKVKNVLEQKHIERRETGINQRNVFTNFIQNIVNVLNKFEDNDLRRFFDIINNEIQRYWDKDDDIHILNKLNSATNMPAFVLRWYLKAISNKIEEEAYYADEKAILDGVNDMFKQDDTTKLDKFVNNLENYRRKSRRNIDLAQVVKLGLRNIFLHSYYYLTPSAKTKLKTILHHYFGSFTSLTTKHPVLRQSSSVKRAKLKTTRGFRTWRQMYVEKNLDLKYPNDYVPVTEKHKYKTITKKSRVLTVSTTRAIEESHHRKGKKYDQTIESDVSMDSSKHSDISNEKSNSDDKSTIIRTTKMIDENDYKRDFYKTSVIQSKQYKTLKDHDGNKENYRRKHKKIIKLSTFYVDLKKLRASRYGYYNHKTTRVYERPVARPIGFTINFKNGINNGKHWDPRQNVKKIKHYGYIQKKIDVVSNEEIKKKKKDPELVRMPPMSLNMQLSVTKEPLTLDYGVEDTTIAVENIYSPLSEEGLSIEGFQETKRLINNRRSNNHNDTVNNNFLNIIHKLEQDLEAVKSKIHNVSVIKNENNLNDFTKVTENNVNKLQTVVNIDERVNEKVINVRNFYEEQHRYDLKNIKKNYSSPDEKVRLNNTEVNEVKPNYMASRKTINDDKWYPVARAREATSDEVIIQRKYEPLKETLPKQSENLKVKNNDITLRNAFPTSNKVTHVSLINKDNSITTINFPSGKVKSKELENSTIINVLPNTKSNENNDSNYNKTLEPILEDRSKNKSTIKDVKIAGSNDNKTIPNNYINVKLTGDRSTHNRNIQKNAIKQNILIEPTNVKDRPKLRSQMDEINNTENVTMKETTKTKSDFKMTSVTNYKNDSTVKVINFITTRIVKDVASDEHKFKKPDIKEKERQYIVINNNNATIVPTLHKLKEISTTNSTTVD